MKRRLIPFVALLLCLLLPLGATAEFAFVQLGTDVYEENDPQSNVLSSYAAGTWVEIEESYGASQDAVMIGVTGPDGLSGYAPCEGLFILSEVVPAQIAVVANGGKYVNLRASASKKAQVLAKVNSGTPMTLIEAGNAFDHVQIGTLDGYMVAGMLKLGLKPIYTPVVEAANGRSVNLRSEPSMNGAVLASIPYGAPFSVYVLGKGWAYGRYGKTDGYVMTKFLTSESPVPTPAPTYGPVPNPNPDSDFWDVNMTCYVSNSGASVRYRSGPGGSASVLGKLASGTEVFVMSTNGAWSKISFGAGGKVAYMMAKYLVTVQPDINDDPTDPIYPDDPVIDDPVIYDDLYDE